MTGSPVEVRNSFVTLPMTRRPTFSNVTDILQHDETRVATFMEYSTHGRRADVPLQYTMDVGYTVSVNIGSPPITYNLLVESSNSMTWIGARSPYGSLTSLTTGYSAAVDYNFGTLQGTVFQDVLSFTDGLTINAMLFGVASTPLNIGFDGTLGIGPRGSSRSAIQNENIQGGTIPSVTDLLIWQGTIRQSVVGILFKPIVADFVNEGELNFGGADPTKYIGNLKYARMATTARSSLHWGINQRIYYGNVEIMPRTAGVVDCGATFLYIGSVAYERYRAATGGIVNAANGLLQISDQQYNLLFPLDFYIGVRIYTLSPNAQIWPRSLNHIVFGVDHDDIFLVIKTLPANSGTECNFIIGYVFLQRFYTVFDAHRSRVGFAETEHTYDDTN
ncbi:aspartic peptidase domain-containing protein [Suillus spraguei]|nr:aspartic peptidase domain-containing protein [Suillus spraguei]